MDIKEDREYFKDFILEGGTSFLKGDVGVSLEEGDNGDDNDNDNLLVLDPFSSFVLEGGISTSLGDSDHSRLSINDIENGSPGAVPLEFEGSRENRLSLDDVDSPIFVDKADDEFALNESVQSLEEDTYASDINGNSFKVSLDGDGQSVGVREGEGEGEDSLARDNVDVSVDDKFLESSSDLEESDDLVIAGEEETTEYWNCFNYEDDGNIIEEYKEGNDFGWPSSEEVLKEEFEEDDNIFFGESAKELKEIFIYLDDLFANLPEPIIKQFALSPYYTKYNDLLDKLNI